jgi:hypothetical protein
MVADVPKEAAPRCRAAAEWVAWAEWAVWASKPPFHLNDIKGRLRAAFYWLNSKNHRDNPARF